MRTEAFIRDVMHIDDAALVARLCAISSLRTFSRGEHMLRAGEPQSPVRLLMSGVARAFEIDAEGNEHTGCLLMHPGTVVVSTADLSEPSTATFEALSECETVAFDAAGINELLQTSLPFSHYFIRCLQAAWNERHSHEEALRRLRSADRYLWFLGRYPGLIDRIPKKHVASFLGMTPVTLSRLRSSLGSVSAASNATGPVRSWLDS